MKKIALMCIAPMVAIGVVQAEVVSGIDSLRYNRDIRFSPKEIVPNHAQFGKAGYVYPCTTSWANPIDVFVAEEIKMPSIENNHILAIGSPRPFYVSKKKFSQTDFSSQLQLNDTNSFKKVDTVRNDPHLPMPDSGSYLPHVSETEFSKSGGDFFVIITEDKQYVVVRPIQIWIQQPSYLSPGYYDYLWGYKLWWYLQTDHTPTFKPLMTGVRNGHFYGKQKSAGKQGAGPSRFDILGRGIASDCHSGLIVIKGNGKNTATKVQLGTTRR